MRLDLYLVKKKLAHSRTQAQDLIKSGSVFLQLPTEERTLKKSNYDVSEIFFDAIFVRENQIQKYVSRGGLKLQAALIHLGFDVKNKTILDVGQSTGGFTDCLLLRGAKHVVGVDVGQGQLHPSLRLHPQVSFFETLHVNQLQDSSEFLLTVPRNGFDLIVADVSFISICKVMPYLHPFLKAQGHFLFLVKPQFELGPNALDKNGLVKDEKNYSVVENEVMIQAKSIFSNTIEYFRSELNGKDGNQEFFIYGQNKN